MLLAPLLPPPDRRLVVVVVVPVPVQVQVGDADSIDDDNARMVVVVRYPPFLFLLQFVRVFFSLSRQT